MGRPLKIKYSGSTFAGLQEMSDSEVDTLADVILDYYADNAGTGDVTVNNSSGGTVIGTFIDEHRNHAVGTHPVGTNDITTTTFTFRQNLTAVSPDTAVRPLAIKGTSFEGLQEMDNADIITNIINKVKAKATAAYTTCPVGFYKLSANVSSYGTWVDIATIIDKVAGGATSETLVLRRRTDASVTYSPTRCLKWNGSIKEMSNAEIGLLADYFRSEIVSSGVGQYRVSSSAPTSGGTWVQTGASISDTLHNVANQTYNKTPGTAGYFYGGNNAYVGLTVQNTVTSDAALKLWVRTA